MSLVCCSCCSYSSSKPIFTNSSAFELGRPATKFERLKSSVNQPSRGAGSYGRMHALDSHMKNADEEALIPSTKLPLSLFLTTSEPFLRAVSYLRVQTFSMRDSFFNAEEHRKYLADAEFEALKERIEGKRQGFKRVACLVATRPVSHALSLSKELSLCKVDIRNDGTHTSELVVGSLDINQGRLLPGEIGGTRPKDSEADHGRAYLSNVCVAKKLHRKGIGSALIKHAKEIARHWGVTDLYVHVVAGNEAAERLYEKNDFSIENEENASDAWLFGRPKRLLLWTRL